MGTRIGVLLVGMAVLLGVGTWGWTEAANAVLGADRFKPMLAVLVVYGVAFLILIIGTGFTYMVFKVGKGGRG
jgi:uncharacterized membrane protein YidH (DUF202 family)